jgi:hypothetical protein
MPVCVVIMTNAIVNTLDGYRANRTSQHGEDGVIAYLTRVFPNIPKICLEVGAGDGFTLSNTHTLWAEQGWQALLIEANSGNFARLSERVRHNPSVLAIEGLITSRGEASLDAITERHGVPARIGVASIDIDSYDYWVFAYLDRLRPSIIVIESNATIPAHVSFADMEDHPLLRASVKALAELGSRKGYRAVACTGPNVILMAEETIAENPGAVPDLPIEGLFDYAYHEQCRPSLWSASAKPITYRPVYTRRPPLAVRSYAWLRFALLSARSRLKGKRVSLRPIDASHKRHLERSGLLT